MALDLFDAMTRRLGDPNAALARRRRMDGNVRFALRGMDDWRRPYANSWIAVHNESLVAVDVSRERLVQILEDSEVPLDETFVGFVNEEKKAYFL